MNPWNWALLLKDAAVGWWNHGAFRFGAALAYYTVVALAPLMILVVGVASLVFGQEHADTQILQEVRNLVGPEGAGAARAVLVHARESESGGLASTLGLVALFIGVVAVFMELQTALNALLGLTTRPDDTSLETAGRRFRSLALVMGVGFLLLVSLVISAALAAAENYVSGLQPGLAAVWWFTGMVLSFAVVTTLFALMFKYMPDAQIAWKDVWVGAAITALLFTVGKYLIGLYLGNSGLSSAYGAAGSVVVVLAWVYYSSLIFFFGAEVTRVYAGRYGSGIQPASNARRAAESVPLPTGENVARQPTGERASVP